MRKRFDEQLQKLGDELTNMGKLCETAISTACDALLHGSGDGKLETVFATDAEIDQKEREIEALCMKLLLQQQPVARDLRQISSALKMISDMERIGDQASDIAEITRFISSSNSDAQSKIHIADMAQATIKMVKDSVESYVKKDLDLARSVIDYDDVVDALFDRVKKELIGLLATGSNDGEVCIDLLMIAKYFERIGDHATNIAEWVEYSMTGAHLP